MKDKSQTIHYSMDTNQFFAINKNTGKAVKSYVNGEKLPSFKPNITGFEYGKRREHDDGIIRKKFYSSKKNSPSPSLQKSSDKLNPYKTLIYKKSNDYGLTTKRNFLTIMSSSSRMSHGNKSPELTGYSSFLTEKQNRHSDFQSSAKKYQEIYESKIKQNHSPNKSIDGSVEKKDMLNTMCLTKTNFRNEGDPQIGYKPRQRVKIPQIKKKLVLPSNLSSKQQIKRDRQIAYRFNPTLQNHEAKESTKIQKDRRQNLMKLERLTIYRNNQLTNKIVLSRRAE